MRMIEEGWGRESRACAERMRRLWGEKCIEATQYISQSMRSYYSSWPELVCVSLRSAVNSKGREEWRSVIPSLSNRRQPILLSNSMSLITFIVFRLLVNTAKKAKIMSLTMEISSSSNSTLEQDYQTKRKQNETQIPASKYHHRNPGFFITIFVPGIERLRCRNLTQIF